MRFDAFMHTDPMSHVLTFLPAKDMSTLAMACRAAHRCVVDWLRTNVPCDAAQQHFNLAPLPGLRHNVWEGTIAPATRVPFCAASALAGLATVRLLVSSAEELERLFAAHLPHLRDLTVKFSADGATMDSPHPVSLRGRVSFPALERVRIAGHCVLTDADWAAFPRLRVLLARCANPRELPPDLAHLALPVQHVDLLATRFRNATAVLVLLCTQTRRSIVVARHATAIHSRTLAHVRFASRITLEDLAPCSPAERSLSLRARTMAFVSTYDIGAAWTVPSDLHQLSICAHTLVPGFGELCVARNPHLHTLTLLAQGSTALRLDAHSLPALRTLTVDQPTLRQINYWIARQVRSLTVWCTGALEPRVLAQFSALQSLTLLHVRSVDWLRCLPALPVTRVRIEGHLVQGASFRVPDLLPCPALHRLELVFDAFAAQCTVTVSTATPDLASIRVSGCEHVSVDVTPPGSMDTPRLTCSRKLQGPPLSSVLL